MRWRLAAADDLLWQELEDEIVVRSGFTGSTHLLADEAGEVFRLLLDAREGLTVTDLAERLREEGIDQDECYASVEAVLTDFRRLGLAEAHSIDRRGPD